MGCGSSKKAVQEVDQGVTSNVPTWLMSRPRNSSYYIGISRISKSMFPADYAEQAKKKALDDLASEIEVKVKANSILYSFEVNDSYKEDFVQSIKLESNVELENYELVDSYETKDEYALYYRLNKAQYLEWKKSLENKQIEISKSWLVKARESENVDVAKEIKYKLMAVEAIKEYWSEPLKTVIEGKEVFYGNYLFSELQSSFDKLSVSMNRLSYRLPYGIALPDGALYVNCTSNGKIVSGLPLELQNSGLTISSNQFVTDINGIASLSGMKGSKPMEVNLRVVPNIKKIASISREVEKALGSGIRLPEASGILYVETPKINIDISGIGISILPSLQTSLSNFSLLYESKKSNADLYCTIKMVAREGGEYNGLFTTFVDVETTIETKAGERLYSKKLIDLKGVDLSYDRARVKAIESFKTKFSREIAPQIKRKLTQ